MGADPARYDLEVLDRFFARDALAGAVVVGILPLHSSRHAEFLHNEVPGITVPDGVRARMREAGERGLRAGIEMAQELAARRAPPLRRRLPDAVLRPLRGRGGSPGGDALAPGRTSPTSAPRRRPAASARRAVAPSSWSRPVWRGSTRSSPRSKRVGAPRPRRARCGWRASARRRPRAGAFTGALHGVPVALKDIFDVAGHAHARRRGGLRPSPARRPTRPRWRGCARAGAVILGKVVTTHLRPHGPGPTRNPWNPEHTPGGSSSGLGGGGGRAHGAARAGLADGGLDAPARPPTAAWWDSSRRTAGSARPAWCRWRGA